MASKKYLRLIKISENVVCELLDEVDKLEEEECITSDQIHKVICNEIKNCAEDWNVDQRTIRENITRGLGMKIHQYSDGIREILTNRSYKSFMSSIQSRAKADDINYCSREFEKIVSLI